MVVVTPVRHFARFWATELSKALRKQTSSTMSPGAEVNLTPLIVQALNKYLLRICRLTGLVHCRGYIPQADSASLTQLTL